MAKKPFSVLFPEDCTELTGVRRYDWKSQVTDLVVNVPFTPGDIPKLQDCTVFFHWPPEFGFLSLEPTERGSNLHRSGETAREAAVRFYDKCGTPLRSKLVADNWFAYRFAEANAKDTAEVGPKLLSIVISIDTSDDRFCEYAESLSGSHVPLAIDIDVDIGGAKSGSPIVELQRDKAVLKVAIPVRRLPPYEGVVAIDFGNTNSTLVAYDTYSGKKGVEFIPADARAIESGQSLAVETRTPTPTPTILELLAYTPQTEEGKPSSYRVNYGTQAEYTETPARLIAGAKRMLADMPESKSSVRMHRVLVGDESVPISIPSHEPAEIFFSRMFEAFLYFVKMEPKQVALTCPSTFTQTEANRLRVAAYNGLRRALRQYDSLHLAESTVKDGSSVAKTVRACLDESTAAAFWFIHEEVLEKRGPGAVEFQYLHPAGMNVLIYDCGGGTTDISLVNVKYDESSRVKIEVLGRRGHRTFGGDFITLQYARYLKYQIYAAANGEFDDAEMHQFLAESSSSRPSELADRVDNVFPTLFDRTAPCVGAAAEAHKRAWAFWSLAERLKCNGFEGDDNDESRDKKAVLRRNYVMAFAKQLERHRITLSEPLKKIVRASNGFAIEKEHIREAVSDALNQTIRYANELIAAKVPNQEVHRVYLVGNASRFPLIREAMLHKGPRGLKVRFLNEKLFGGGVPHSDKAGYRIESDDLKNCVAKGAAVANSIQNQQKAIADWDEDVMKKLPYSIEYQGPLPPYRPRVLFNSGTPMDKAQKALEAIQVHADAKGKVQESLRLSRRWPGACDEELEEFLIFRFPKPMVEGQYALSYDSKGFYEARCLDKPNDDLVAKGQPLVFPPTVPPSQSGEF